MGVARRELITAGTSACRKGLEALGFTWHVGDFLTVPLAPQLFGWVGLGHAVHRGDGSMQITPWVGLLHQDVERLVATLVRVPYHRYQSATIQTIVGTLAPEPEDLRVTFYPRQPVTEPAERVIELVREYGLPWAREHASLAAIYNLVVRGQFTVALHPFKPPIIAWMLGRPDVAHQLMREHLARITEQGGPNAAGGLEVYERFATALEQRMVRPWTPPAGS
jgi:hypothetical protein